MSHLPMEYLVYSLLVKLKRTLSDREIFEELKSNNPWVSLPQLEEALLKLEVLGLIRVYGGSKEGLLVELAEGSREFPLPDEE